MKVEFTGEWLGGRGRGSTFEQVGPAEEEQVNQDLEEMGRGRDPGPRSSQCEAAWRNLDGESTRQQAVGLDSKGRSEPNRRPAGEQRYCKP